MNPNSHYTTTVRVFHWVVAVCVIAALALIELKDFAPKGSVLRNGMKAAHMQFGLTVLLLFLPRIWFAFTGPVPPVTPPMPGWQVAASKLVHIALYVLLIATPVVGFVFAQAEGKSLSLLGVPMPVLFAKDHAFAEQFEEIHELLGNIMLYLAILHAAAAVFHHRVQKDDTLLRMLPRRGG